MLLAPTWQKPYIHSLPRASHMASSHYQPNPLTHAPAHAITHRRRAAMLMHSLFIRKTRRKKGKVAKQSKSHPEHHRAGADQEARRSGVLRESDWRLRGRVGPWRQSHSIANVHVASRYRCERSGINTVSAMVAWNYPSTEAHNLGDWIDRISGHRYCISDGKTQITHSVHYQLASFHAMH